MTRVVAPAKLTLSLRITGTREDGYHLIVAEMVTLDLADELVITPGDGVAIRDHTASGFEVRADDDNLVRRALRLCGRRAHVVIDKRIPAGAGLGGGSADAAAVLRWAGYTDFEGAATIGADVAFCLIGGRARVSGIGEVVEPQPYAEQSFTLLTPPFGCSTPAVYRMWDRMGGPRGDHGNDLEPAALEVEPRLGSYRDRLWEVAGQRPRLAGSGSTWFVEGTYAGAGLIPANAVPAPW